MLYLEFEGPESAGGRSRSGERGRHKRSSTFDKVSDKVEESVSDVAVSKKHERKGTFTKEEEGGEEVEEEKGRGRKGSRSSGVKLGRNSGVKENEISPGVQRMINAMDNNMTADEMKASLMKELDKRAKDKVPGK